jgi:Holliday junction DNA helicase RuvA
VIIAIHGEIIAKEAWFCDILTAGGVAYRLFITLTTFANLGAIGDKAKLLASQIVREDSLSLFGFVEAAERDLFEQLIKVTGIGPKTAIAILSTYRPAQFAEIVASGDETALAKVPGIGKKTASLTIVQLGGKVETFAGAGGAKKDAFAALETLGYKAAEIAKALAKCKAENTAEIIKEALKIIRK